MPGTAEVTRSFGSKSHFGPLGDALCCSPVTQTTGMPPRASLNTSSRASRKVISKATNQTTEEGDAEPAVDNNNNNNNTFTSALDVSARRQPTTTTTTALRRRGSDGDFPRYRASSSHHDKYPSMDGSSSSRFSPNEPHPLRRATSTTARPPTRRVIHDTGNNTRPRLSRVLSPSTPALVVAKYPPPSPPPPAADFAALSGPPDRVAAAAESHRAVLAHEVRHRLMGPRYHLPTRQDVSALSIILLCLLPLYDMDMDMGYDNF
jgi:hypothetical protein